MLLLLLLLLGTHLPSYAPCWQPWFPYTEVQFLVGVRLARLFPQRSPLEVPLWVCGVAPMVLDTQLRPSHFGQAWRPAAVLDTESHSNGVRVGRRWSVWRCGVWSATDTFSHCPTLYWWFAGATAWLLQSIGVTGWEGFQSQPVSAQRAASSLTGVGKMLGVHLSACLPAA